MRRLHFLWVEMRRFWEHLALFKYAEGVDWTPQHGIAAASAAVLHADIVPSQRSTAARTLPNAESFRMPCCLRQTGGQRCWISSQEGWRASAVQ